MPRVYISDPCRLTVRTWRVYLRMENRYYTVAGISGPVALLLDDDEHRIAVPIGRLPRATRGGSVLSVPLNTAGTPSWSDAAIDDGEAKRRLGKVGHDTEGPENGEEA